MSTATGVAPTQGGGRGVRRGPGAPALRRFAPPAVLVVVLVLMLTVGTTYAGGKTASAGANGGVVAFSPAQWAQKNFPAVQKYISTHAIAASTLVADLKKDPTGAKVGITPNGAIGPEIPVKFTGVVKSNTGGGIYNIAVSGVPTTQVIHLVTGPAILSTDLRDVSGQYTQNTPGINNQTDFLNAALALNNVMKSQVLAKAGVSDLTGKTVTVEGAFGLINPALWTITPSKLTVS
ncbi:DUF2291 family protein [Allobranchiibius sp. GilTou73]|uniref:DUF2291 family protein n=1 Tax=Allobranchiibius sp. GilTou73 TaxID=2904523 RepID=UPI001F1938CE|nr:DUF2291 family protein [Allobranchiibius sp. GilTou73]UIJ35219.1 DUF2291 domain-containing protein [Allobranchiibius sp. GilTou73]